MKTRKWLIAHFKILFHFGFFPDKNVIPFGPTITTELKDKEVAKGEPFVIFRCGAIGL